MARPQGWAFVPPRPSSPSRPAPCSSPLPCGPSASAWTCVKYKRLFAWRRPEGSPAKLAMGRTGAGFALLTLLLLPQPASQFWLFNVLFPPTSTPEAPPTNSTPPVVLGKVTSARPQPARPGAGGEAGALCSLCPTYRRPQRGRGGVRACSARGGVCWQRHRGLQLPTAVPTGWDLPPLAPLPSAPAPCLLLLPSDGCSIP